MQTSISSSRFRLHFPRDSAESNRSYVWQTIARTTRTWKEDRASRFQANGQRKAGVRTARVSRTLFFFSRCQHRLSQRSAIAISGLLRYADVLVIGAAYRTENWDIRQGRPQASTRVRNFKERKVPRSLCKCVTHCRTFERT